MCTQDFPKMDHFIDTKIPKLGIFDDKNSQNDQTPFPKVGRKTPGFFLHLKNITTTSACVWYFIKTDPVCNYRHTDSLKFLQ